MRRAVRPLSVRQTIAAAMVMAATCAMCAEMTEVPFIPRGDRPVYCSACFNKVREQESAKPGTPSGSQAPV